MKDVTTRPCLNEAQAALYLGISESALRKSRMNGPRANHLPPPPYVKLGRRVIYRPADLDSLLESNLASWPTGGAKMSHAPPSPFSAAKDACTLCSTPLKAIPALGIYLVGSRGAIHCPLCSKCVKLAQKGLPPDQLRQLDQKLEARATELGLNQTK